jgi:RNA polymerase sigma factor (sigma-70 family)
MASPLLQHIRRLIAIETASQASDAALLERFVAQRDESAFTLLLERHGPMVLRLARRLLGQEQDAEDIFQATFLLFARKAGTIRKRQSVSSWLYGVAYRLAGRAREQRAHRKAQEKRAATMHAAKPQAATAWQDLQELLEDVLAQLPEKYRTPLILCYLEGKTQEQAAQQLGCPLGTVRSWLARGRSLLRRRLARRGVALSSGALATALLAEAVSAAAADLPPALLQSTLKAALRFVAGQELVGMVSAQVAALVKGGLSAMMMAKIKGAITVLIALTVLALGSGVVAERVSEAKQRALVSGTEPATAADRSASPKPQQGVPTGTDAYGDPLPATALRRVGTLRFRKEGRVNCLLKPGGQRCLASLSSDHGPP